MLGVAVASPLLVATACSSSESEEQQDSDDQLREDVAAQEARLIAAYDATILKFPALTAQLTPFRDQHAEHKQALVPGESATPTVTAPDVPGTATAAVRALRRLEKSAAGDRIESCGKANAPELARSLSLIAASEAQHNAALKGSQ